jgi:glycosyltransferase involved in cell wall biosynthesis
MPTEPLFSIVVIFYNAERFLGEAIDSVLGQTEEDWELLLVDDGSKDGGTAIAQEYADRAPEKIRYIRHPDGRNHGMSATRNLGIRNSRGDWIAFLDSDDVWLPSKLAEQKALVSAHTETGLLYGSPLYWFSWSSELSRFPDCQPGISVASDTLVSPPNLMLLNHPLGEGPAPCPSDFIVRKGVAERVGGFEESFGGVYQMYEDQAFLAKVYLTTPVFVSGRCWTHYRQSLSACTAATRDSGAHLEVRRFFLDYLERYLRDQRNIDQRNIDPQIWRAIARARWPYNHPRLSRITSLYRRGLRRLRRSLPGVSVASGLNRPDKNH